MPRRHLRLRVQDEPAGRELRAGFARIRAELELPEEFPADVLAEAEAAAAAPDLPAVRRDRPAVPHHRPARVDGPGPGDAPRATRRGFRVRYAIADVAAFVAPGRRDRRGGAPARSRRSTARTRAPRCTRRCCPGRGVAAARPGAAGAAVDDRPRRRRRADALSTYAGPLVRSRGPARLRRRAGPRSTRARPTSGCSCSPRWASCGGSARSSAAASACRSPSRRSSRTATRSGSSTACRCRWSRGTSRSRC